MHTLLLVFGGLEAALLLISLATFAWGCVRGWELQVFMPIGWAVYGTILLVVAFFVAVVVHDHVHVHVS